MKLYAFTGPAAGGDRHGFLVAENGEVLRDHVSSSKQWSLSDLTQSFGRADELKARFPEGYEVIELTQWADAPQELREANIRWTEEHKEARLTAVT